MQIEAHAAAGWLIAELAPGDRRLRQFVLGAAIFPDLDAISYLFGHDAYGYYHHRITHTLIFAVVYTAVAIFLCCNNRVKALIAVPASFASHFLSDMLLTRYKVYLFYPFSDKGFLFDSAVPLWHPLNKVVLLLGWVTIIILSIRNKRTPLEAVSLKLDRKIVTETQEWWHKRKAGP